MKKLGIPENPPLRLMTVHDLADYLRVSEAKVYRMANTGKLPACRVGKALRFQKELIDDWIRREIDVKFPGGNPLIYIDPYDTIMTKHWYVYRSKPNKEMFLAEQLELRRIEVFCPRIRVQVVNPRARKVRSYFPGYLFIHADLNSSNFSGFQFMPGAAGLVTFGGETPNVPDGLISAIRQRVDEINAAGGELLEALKPGAEVVIHSGPLSGYQGIFDERLPGTERVRVLLKFLKDRQQLVELPAGQIRLKKFSPRRPGKVDRETR